jgi:hypothetical protein
MGLFRRPDGTTRCSLPVVASSAKAALIVVAAFGGLVHVAVNAQPLPPRTGDKRVKFDAGSTAQRFVLTVTEPPAPGDSIEIRLSTRQITVGITTPGRPKDRCR